MKKFLFILAALSALLCSCNKEAVSDIPEGYGVVNVSVSVKEIALTRGTSAMDELPWSDYKNCKIKFGTYVWDQSTSKLILPEGTYAITIESTDCSTWSCFSNRIPFKSSLGSITVKQGQITDVTLNPEYVTVSVMAVSKLVAVRSGGDLGTFATTKNWYYFIMTNNIADNAGYANNSATFNSVSDDKFGFSMTIRPQTNNSDVEFYASGTSYGIYFGWKANTMIVIDDLPSKSGVSPLVIDPKKNDITEITVEL